MILNYKPLSVQCQLSNGTHHRTVEYGKISHANIVWCDVTSVRQFCAISSQDSGKCLQICEEWCYSDTCSPKQMVISWCDMNALPCCDVSKTFCAISSQDSGKCLQFREERCYSDMCSLVISWRTVRHIIDNTSPPPQHFHTIPTLYSLHSLTHKRSPISAMFSSNKLIIHSVANLKLRHTILTQHCSCTAVSAYS